MKNRVHFFCLSATIPLLLLSPIAKATAPTHAQGEMAGEATASSIILQSRLTNGKPRVNEDVQGSQGVARFEISTQEDLRK